MNDRTSPAAPDPALHQRINTPVYDGPEAFLLDYRRIQNTIDQAVKDLGLLVDRLPPGYRGTHGFRANVCDMLATQNRMALLVDVTKEAVQHHAIREELKLRTEIQAASDLLAQEDQRVKEELERAAKAKPKAKKKAPAKKKSTKKPVPAPSQP